MAARSSVGGGRKTDAWANHGKLWDAKPEAMELTAGGGESCAAKDAGRKAAA